MFSVVSDCQGQGVGAEFSSITAQSNAATPQCLARKCPTYTVTVLVVLYVLMIWNVQVIKLP